MKNRRIDPDAELNRRTEQALGDAVICDRCGATLATYAEACSADIDDPCLGFQRIEETKARLLAEGADRG